MRLHDFSEFLQNAMLHRIQILIISMLIYGSARALYNHSTHLFPDRLPPLPQDLLPYQNAEGYLALGYKLPFEILGVYELELLPKLSDGIAQRLIDAREEILTEASLLPEEKKYQALKKVKGIGEKKARLLERYLDLTR